MEERILSDCKFAKLVWIRAIELIYYEYFDFLGG